ncbi:MAG: type II toxin-antitoxin system RelE family toxin [Acidimicrobiales bacterium]
MYRVELGRRAERGLRRIRHGDPRGYQRVVRVIRSLGEDPRPPDAVKLTGFDPPAWRVRVGDYRIVYEINDADVIVIVVNVAPRGEVYR